MNVSFKTHFPWVDTNGEPVPTHFAQQIVNSMLQGASHGAMSEKRHTMRRVKNGRRRFRPGMKLVFTVGSRFKPIPFAETTCESVQLVRMQLQPIPGAAGVCLMVDIDGKACGNDMLRQLARYDGFYNPPQGMSEDFLRWFMLDLMQNGSPAEYEMIHWTSMRY
jgi:hypothetical protein